MNDCWKLVVRGALTLIIFVSFTSVSPVAGWDRVRLQEAARPKKIVFWAGPKEHGAPGRHEYERDLTELAWQLEHATNLSLDGVPAEGVASDPERRAALDVSR